MVTVITINHMARAYSSGTDLDILTNIPIMVIEMAIVMGDAFNAGEISTDEVVIMGITEPAIVQQHGVIEIAGVGK